MGYNPNFRLNPKQLGLIEEALRSEMSRRAWPSSEEQTVAATNQDGPADNTQGLREINELLAHLHHQKWWYEPKQRVPMG